MIPLAVAAALILGIGGTALASDSARPGDVLFPIDRAAEEARLAMALDADAKAELRARFAEERVAEFEEIVDEETKSDGRADASAQASTTVSAQGEARVEHALSVLEGFLADAHVRASSTANARATLNALDARFEAAITKLPSELRMRLKDEVNGNADVNGSADARLKLDVQDGEIKVENSTSSSVRANTDAGASTSSSGVKVNVDGSLNVR